MTGIFLKILFDIFIDSENGYCSRLLETIWMEPLGLKSEANVEVPKTCILSTSQQWVTPMV